MFEPFTTGDSGKSGMGLAIARKIIEQHGGNIRAEEKGDRRVTVTVEIPAAETGESEN